MRYYYGQLSRPLQGVYDALLGGFRALAPGIRIPMLDEKQLADVYLRLKLDEPLLFYVTGYRCRWMTGAAHMELLPEYLFDKAKIRTHQQAVSARLARLTKPLEGKTEAEKALAVHDFILENVRYDKLKKPYSHEILGPMTQGVGVCEGIAKTVKALCDQLGLWCIVALSEADPARGIKYRHTWNVVRVGGQYYHLDATFDNSLQRGEKRYDYYNLDDGRLFRDHTPLVLPVPACTDGKRFYYRSVSFTKPEELEKQLGREPTVDEIAQKTGLSRREVSAALESVVEPLSLEEPVYADGGDAVYVIDQVRDPDGEDSWISGLQFRQTVAGLTPREKKIMELRYLQGKTQMEVAQEIGISQAQVSRLEKGALSQFRTRD